MRTGGVPGGPEGSPEYLARLTSVRDVVIDTDVTSLLQKHQAPPWVLRHLAGARIWLTFVTVGELAKWAVVRR